MADYWKDRFEYLEKQIHDKAGMTLLEVIDQYNIALKKINEDIERWFYKFAKDEDISLAEARRLLRSDELKEFKMTVDEYIEKGRTLNYTNEWEKELKRASAKWHVSRLDSLKLQLRQHAEEMYGYEEEAVRGLLSDVYETGYYHSAYEIQKGVGVAWELSGIDKNRIEKLLAKPWTPDGLEFSERIWGKHRPELVSYLERELTQTIIRGEAPQNLINDISKKFNAKRSQAANLVMTETAYFHSASQKDCFNDLNVEKYKVIATLDMKTSEICREMDGKIFDMKDYQIGVTAHPFHNRCRTVEAPCILDIESYRVARGKDGKTYKVSSTLTYKEWFEKYVKKG